MKLTYYIIPILLLFSCTNQETELVLDASQLREIPVPCTHAGEPNVFVSETGTTYLSWIEHLNDSIVALQFSTLKNKKWTAPKKIASGTNWFVNWADFPSLAAYEDDEKSLAAHWLQKSAKGTYDYDVRIAQSQDGGATWQPSFIPHRDGIAAEHGFVTMLPLSSDRMFATWLDGRHTKGDDHDAHGHGHGGDMTLRAATFDPQGNLYDETELDHRVCDCCQTDATLTDDGVVVVYRDRSPDEVRDISIVRKTAEGWLQAQTVHADNWEIAGCPVNGPAVDALDNRLAVAWFTMANDEARVFVIFSENGGRTFGEAVHVDEGSPLGRVDVLWLNSQEILVTWIEETPDQTTIKARQITAKGEAKPSFTITQTDAARKSGFPIIKKNEEQIIFAWTHVDSLTSVRTVVTDL